MNLASFLLLALFHPPLADIIPIPGSQRVKPVFDSSDLVCYCAIQAVHVSVDPLPANGTTGWVRQRVTTLVQVRDAYKQSQATETTITVQHDQDVPNTSGSYTIFREGETFLLFLKASGPKEYRLADSFLGATHFGALPQIRRPLGLKKLEDAMTIEAAQSTHDDAINALRILQGFDDPTQETLSAMHVLSASPDPETAFAAVSVEMNSGRPEALQTLIGCLNAHPGAAEPWALINISTKLAQFRADQAVLNIKQLTHSRYTSIRDGALRALRARKGPRTVPTLVERLDDEDATIRYLAVITLAETLGKYDGDYAPSMYLFDKKPQYYISLWKEWWTEEGSRLYAPNP